MSSTDLGVSSVSVREINQRQHGKVTLRAPTSAVPHKLLAQAEQAASIKNLRGVLLPDSRRRRLSHQTAPTPIPSHGRREGAPLAPHAACWAVRMSMAAAHATLAASLGGRSAEV